LLARCRQIAADTGVEDRCQFVAVMRSPASGQPADGDRTGLGEDSSREAARDMAILDYRHRICR
jgi:hypothetical protein